MAVTKFNKRSIWCGRRSIIPTLSGPSIRQIPVIKQIYRKAKRNLRTFFFFENDSYTEALYSLKALLHMQLLWIGVTLFWGIVGGHKTWLMGATLCTFGNLVIWLRIYAFYKKIKEQMVILTMLTSDSSPTAAFVGGSGQVPYLKNHSGSTTTVGGINKTI